MTLVAGNAPAQRRCLGARGFTLIEVLAALVIVALGMLGVIEAVTQTARNGTYLRDKSLAHWVAMNVLTERRLEQSAPEIGENSDEVEMAGQRWRWSMKVTQTGVDSMRRMDVSVGRADSAKETRLATVSGFYGTALRLGAVEPIPWDGAGAPGGGDGDDTGDDATDDGDDPGDASDDGDDDGGNDNPPGIPGGGETPPVEEPPGDDAESTGQ